MASTMLDLAASLPLPSEIPNSAMEDDRHSDHRSEGPDKRDRERSPSAASSAKSGRMAATYATPPSKVPLVQALSQQLQPAPPLPQHHLAAPPQPQHQLPAPPKPPSSTVPLGSSDIFQSSVISRLGALEIQSKLNSKSIYELEKVVYETMIFIQGGIHESKGAFARSGELRI